MCPSYDEPGRALPPSSGIPDHKYLTSVYARVNHQTNSNSGNNAGVKVVKLDKYTSNETRHCVFGLRK